MGMEGRLDELLEQGAYPDAPEGVELRQTHISYLFLTPAYVYKIKKPVDFGFLDFTTLEKRHKYCNEEVRLNRRLAPHVYLGVVEVRDTPRGLRMEGEEGRTIEYAVKMRRLSQETILEEKIGRGTVTQDEIRRVAHAIAVFHRAAGQGPHISEYGAPEAIKRNIDENVSQTETFAGVLLSKKAFKGIRSYSHGFLSSNLGLFLERVKGGFIRDCHGDIHSEHISINRDIEIIDCIEFNERFRYSDTISDIAFLSMDLDFHNRPDLARVLEEAYIEASGDKRGRGLMGFYKAYRAYIRGKVEGLKAMEGEVARPERLMARMRAARYFDLAREYASGRSSPRPRLIIICGISGTGKSSLATELGRVLWATPLSTDRRRRGTGGKEGPESHAEGACFSRGRYSLEERARVYDELIRRAGEYLEKGRTIILDATFSRNLFLDKALDAAREAGLEDKDMAVFECRLEKKALLERVRRREAEGPAPGMPLSEMRSDILLKHIKEYEKKEVPLTRLDTSLVVEKNLLKIMDVIMGTGDSGRGTGL